VFIPGLALQPGPMFASKAAFYREIPGRLLALYASIRLDRKGMKWDKLSSLLGPFVSYEEKSFVKLTHFSQEIRQ